MRCRQVNVTALKLMLHDGLQVADYTESQEEVQRQGPTPPMSAYVLGLIEQAHINIETQKEKARCYLAAHPNEPILPGKHAKKESKKKQRQEAEEARRTEVARSRQRLAEEEAHHRRFEAEEAHLASVRGDMPRSRRGGGYGLCGRRGGHGGGPGSSQDEEYTRNTEKPPKYNQGCDWDDL